MDRTPHQQRIIRRWYRNLDALQRQRLEELVADVWLATTPARRDKLWRRVAELLEACGVPPEQAGPVVEGRDAEALARLVREAVAE